MNIACFRSTDLLYSTVSLLRTGSVSPVAAFAIQGDYGDGSLAR